MFLIPRKRIWTQQPQYPTTLEHGLDVLFSAPLAGFGAIEYKSNRLGTVIGAPVTEVNSLGVLTRFGSGKRITFPALTGITGSTPVTIAWTQEAVSASGFCTTAEIGYGGSASFLIYNSTSNNSYGISCGSSLGNAKFTTAGLLINGEVNKFALVCAAGLAGGGASFTLFKNGIRHTGSTTAISALASSVVEIGSRSSGTEFFNGRIGNFTIINGSNEDLARSLSESPWQIFRAPDSRIWVPSAGGGATSTTTISATTDNAVGSVNSHTTAKTSITAVTENAVGNIVSVSAASVTTSINAVTANTVGSVASKTTCKSTVQAVTANVVGSVASKATCKTAVAAVTGNAVGAIASYSGAIPTPPIAIRRGGQSNVRSQYGPPSLEAFRSGSGTPIVVDIANGRLYILRNDEVIVDCLLLSDNGVWDDLRFPAQSINPGGAVAAPAVSTDLNGFPGTLDFSGTQINIITGAFQMPHAWQDGTEIHPHIHWMKSVAGAGVVGWQFKWRKMPINEAAGVWSAWLDGVSAAFNAPETAADWHYITAFPAIDMTGLGDSDMIAWQMQRLGNTDAYNSVARLLEFDVHYRSDRLGSEVEYPTV